MFEDGAKSRFPLDLTQPHRESNNVRRPGQRLGVDEAIVVSDPITLTCLKYLCQGLAAGDRLLGLSERKLRTSWAHVTACLQLQALVIRPYSLRRGGATHRYREEGNLHTVASRGRWSSLTTTRRYIDDGVAALATLQLSAWQEQQMQALARVWHRFLAEMETTQDRLLALPPN